MDLEDQEPLTHHPTSSLVSSERLGQKELPASGKQAQRTLKVLKVWWRHATLLVYF
jgi:hypothetical protein